MNVGQYRQLLSDLEIKKAELTQIHDQYAYGYAKVVLADAKNGIQAEIDALLSIDLIPVPVVVTISSVTSTLNKAVGQTEQLAITAIYSDSSSRDVTRGWKSVATFRDADTGYDNVGFITSVDASGFVTLSTAVFNLMKTTSGWNVSSNFMVGLEVAATGTPNEFDIIDIDGNPIGVTFVTNGNETKADNWIIQVDGIASGTSYASSDPTVATVSVNGLVTAVSAGTADITITNNGSTIAIPVTVA